MSVDIPLTKTERIGDWMGGYQMPIPSLKYSANKAVEVLRRLGNTEAVELAEQVLNVCDAAADVEYDWEQQKQNDPLTRPATQALDDEIDRTLSHLLQTIEAYAGLNGDGEPKEAAEELVGELFPSGVYPITSQPFNRQFESVNTLLDRLRGKFSGHVDVLNLEPMVSQLEELNEEFGEELDTAGEQVTYDQVEAARVEARDAFDKLFAKLMHDYADDMETFNRVIAGYQDQTRRIRRSMQRKGVMPEVDPETGDPVEEGASGQNDGGSGDGDSEGSPEDSETDGNQESSGSRDGTEN